jgi:putative membrane protein
VKRGVIVAVVLGLAAVMAVVAFVGFAAVARAFLTLGWRSLATLVVCSAAPVTLLGTAWWTLDKPWRPRRWPVHVWARMVRDAGGELLPFSQLGGVVMGARAAVLQGLAPAWASASMVVDVTTELIAQLGFTCLGIALLAARLDTGSMRHSLVAAALAGLAVTAAGAVGLIAFQRRGFGVVMALARRFLPAAAVGAAETGEIIGAIHRRWARLVAATLIHLGAWVASGLSVWLALRAGGVDIGPLAILGLESLVLGLRSATVVAPMGIGVQEAGYAFLGPLFGLGPEVAVALSLLKRARDAAVGIPILFLWQGLEGRRLLLARSGEGSG